MRFVSQLKTDPWVRRLKYLSDPHTSSLKLTALRCHTPDTPSYTVIHYHNTVIRTVTPHLVWRAGSKRLSTVTGSWMTCEHRQRKLSGPSKRPWSSPPLQTHQNIAAGADNSYSSQRTEPDGRAPHARLSGRPRNRAGGKRGFQAGTAAPERRNVEERVGRSCRSGGWAPRLGANPGILLQGDQPPGKVRGSLGAREKGRWKPGLCRGACMCRPAWTQGGERAASASAGLPASCPRV